MSEKDIHVTTIGQVITIGDNMASSCTTAGGFGISESFVMIYTPTVDECSKLIKNRYLEAAERVGAWG